VILTYSSLISIRFGVFYTRRVRILHPQVGFLYEEYDFYTNSVILSHRVRLSHVECDLKTHEYDFNLQSVILTITTVFVKLTSEILTRKSVTSTRSVLF
jgi:hypothetical protein